MRIVNWIALLLVIIGALNWGMVGFFGIDVVTGIFGGSFQIARIIFAIVGIAGLWSFTFFKKIGCCRPKNDSNCKPNNNTDYRSKN